MDQKIIFACHDSSPLYQPVLKSLRELKFDAYFFNYYKSSLLVRALGLINNLPVFKNRMKRKIIDQQINKDLINKVRQIEPEYLLVSKGLHIKPQTINEIKRLGTITINWFPDFWEFLPWMEKNASCYDYFFDADLLVVDKLNKLGIKSHYLPYATFPDKKIIKVIKKHNLIFVGQYTKRRERFFKPLVNLGLKIWGYPAWKESCLKSCYQGILPSLQDVFQKYREAKIVLNAVTGEDNIPVKTVNLRVFEVCGVGGFVLNWYKEPIDDFYREGKEIVNFRSLKDLYGKAEYYLKHEKERELIAIKAWERTVKEHTFKKRFEKMFRIIKNSS